MVTGLNCIIELSASYSTILLHFYDVQYVEMVIYFTYSNPWPRQALKICFESDMTC